MPGRLENNAFGPGQVSKEAGGLGKEHLLGVLSRPPGSARVLQAMKSAGTVGSLTPCSVSMPTHDNVACNTAAAVRQEARLGYRPCCCHRSGHRSCCLEKAAPPDR